MKICILSMQKVNNYGSVLQAYSLKKNIENLGHTVDFIDIKKGQNEELNSQCSAQAVSDKVAKNNWICQKMKGIVNKISNRETSKIYSQFREHELGIGNGDNLKRYDVCVIGSDEVFNCLQKSKWWFDPQLFGEVEVADRVITYAASCGSTNVDKLTKGLKIAIGKAMTNLSAISVRDENTASFVKAFSKKEYVYNLDPVAITDFRKEIENTSLNKKLTKPYCIVYAYKDRICNKNEIDAILNYCNENNLEIIAPFGKQRWISEKGYHFTPFELLKLFQNSECIITDTFHGTIFGAKFAKKMAIIVRESNKNKLEDLTKRLEIEQHILRDCNNLHNILSIELNKKNIDSILEKEREKSLEYLKSNLER